MDAHRFLDFFDKRDELLEAGRVALAAADLGSVPEGRYVELFGESGADGGIVIEAPASAERLDFIRIGFNTGSPAEIAAFKQRLDERRGELVREIVFDDVSSVLFYRNKIAVFLNDETTRIWPAVFLYSDESDGFQQELEFQEGLYRRSIEDDEQRERG